MPGFVSALDWQWNVAQSSMRSRSLTMAWLLFIVMATHVKLVAPHVVQLSGADDQRAAHLLLMPRALTRRRPGCVGSRGRRSCLGLRCAPGQLGCLCHVQPSECLQGLAVLLMHGRPGRHRMAYGASQGRLLCCLAPVQQCKELVAVCMSCWPAKVGQ